MTAAPRPAPMVMSTCAPASTQFSTTENTGPMMVKVMNEVTSTVHSGVTNRSIISGTCLCSHFSMYDISRMDRITGMTWP